VDVRFLGNQAHAKLPQHFNAAEVVVLPSLYEGHPKVLLEAMACGRPVIGTNVQGIREIIQHGKTGWLCNTDSDSIRTAIQELMRCPRLRAQLGHNARQYTLKHVSLDHIVDMELTLLRSVVER
jgi:glycosyltransferase involved in cell wall biosynthesis